MNKSPPITSVKTSTHTKDVFDAPQLHAAYTVGHSFRSGMLASYTSEKRYTTFAWQTLAQLACDPVTVDTLVTQMTDFVQNVERTATRRIEILPQGCPGLCRDECLAVSILAASQQNACPAFKACAYALLESCTLEPTLQSAEKLGTTLRSARICLSPLILQDGLSLTLLRLDQKLFHA